MDSAEEPDAFTLPTTCNPPATLHMNPVLHARPSSSLCTPEIFDMLFTACLDQETQSQSACSDAEEYSGKAMSCFSDCMATFFTAKTATRASDVWGGVIVRSDQPGLYFFDIGGCVAALDPSPAGQKCAKDFEGLLECQALSCAGCTVPSDPTEAQVTAYDDCEMSAPCSSYITNGPIDCASEYDAATSPAAVCLQAADTLNSSTSTAAEATAAIRTVVAAVCAPAALHEIPDGGGG